MLKIFYALILVGLSTASWGHGGVANEGNLCKLKVGPYVMGFSGYQPENNVSKQFCDDLPGIGKSIIVLDFIDDKLRDMTVNFRVLKSDSAALGNADDGVVNEAELAQTPFFEIPAKHYPTGSMTISQEFKEEGHFVGYVIVEGENERFVSRFPFSVGMGTPMIMDSGSWWLVVLGMLLVGFIRFLFFKKEPKVGNKD